MRRVVGQRASVWLTCTVVLLAVMQGCTGEVVPPASSAETTTSMLVTSSTAEITSSAQSTEVSTSAEIPTSASESTVTVPAEASALPLPADNTTVEALNPQEQADRTAIEAVWRQTWDLYSGINEIPSGDRATKVDALMIDPIRSQLLNGASQNDAAGLTQYGSITLHPYWYRAVNGLPYAVIGDCRDTSEFGDKEVTTGAKRTVGVVDSNTVGHFVRDADGSWRLWNVTYVTDIPCKAT